MAHTVFCARYKQQMEGLDEPPFDSDFGNKIYHNVSKKAWQEWLEHQKMLLNEYRLQPWTPRPRNFSSSRWTATSSAKALSCPRSTCLHPTKGPPSMTNREKQCRIPMLEREQVEGGIAALYDKIYQ